MRQQYADGIEKVFKLAQKTATSPRIIRQALEDLTRDMFRETRELPWTHPDYVKATTNMVRAIRGYENKKATQAKKRGRLKHPFTPFLDDLIATYDFKRAQRQEYLAACACD